MIPIETNELRGLIFSHHRSLREFSDAIGWQKKKTSRIMLGIQEPTLKDVKEIAVHFKLSRQEFLELFFDGLFEEGGNT